MSSARRALSKLNLMARGWPQDASTGTPSHMIVASICARRLTGTPSPIALFCQSYHVWCMVAFLLSPLSAAQASLLLLTCYGVQMPRKRCAQHAEKKKPLCVERCRRSIHKAGIVPSSWHGWTTFCHKPYMCRCCLTAESIEVKRVCCRLVLEVQKLVCWAVSWQPAWSWQSFALARTRIDPQVGRAALCITAWGRKQEKNWCGASSVAAACGIFAACRNSPPGSMGHTRLPGLRARRSWPVGAAPASTRLWDPTTIVITPDGHALAEAWRLLGHDARPATSVLEERSQRARGLVWAGAIPATEFSTIPLLLPPGGFCRIPIAIQQRNHPNPRHANGPVPGAFSSCIAQTCRWSFTSAKAAPATKQTRVRLGNIRRVSCGHSARSVPIALGVASADKGSGDGVAAQRTMQSSDR